MKKRRAVMAAVAVLCAGVIAVGFSGCEWFSFNGKHNTPTDVSDTLGYYGSDTAAWLTSKSESPLEERYREYQAAIQSGLFTEEDLSFADYLKAMKEDSASLSSALRASVLIQTNKSLGSGVIYSIADEANANGSKNAYVITNNHVIEGSSSIYTYLYGDNYTVDSILPSALETTNVGSSKTEDIAVLSVEIPEDRLDFVQAVSAAVGTRDSDTAKVGEKIYAIGNPLGYGISVLSGSVSVEVENEYVVSRLSMRIDAPVTHGSSGGGLFDREGKLVGIVYGGLDQKVLDSNGDESTVSITGFGWAIPANRALSVAQCIIDNYESNRNGAATYGLLGTLEVESSRGEFDPLTQTIDIIEEVKIAAVESRSPFHDPLNSVKGKIIKSITVEKQGEMSVNLVIKRKHQVETVLFNIRKGDSVTLNFADGSSAEATYSDLSHFSVKR